MSDDHHRIMNIAAEDAPDKLSPEDLGAVLRELRQFANENPSNPSFRLFEEWSESAGTTCQRYFGDWNSAVAAVGGSPNEPKTSISKEGLSRRLTTPPNGGLNMR